MPRFPQEILDHIVDVLRTHRPTLGVLSIVSHCFSRRAQTYLHHTVTIQGARRLLDASTKDMYGGAPVLAGYVRVLGVRIYPLLRPPPAFKALFNHIVDATKETEVQADDVYRLVRCFPMLEAIDIACCLSGQPPSSSPCTPLSLPHAPDSGPVLSSAPRLHSLRLEVAMYNCTDAEAAFYRTMIHTVDISAATSLSLRMHNAKNANELLEQCNKQLRCLLLEHAFREGECWYA